MTSVCTQRGEWSQSKTCLCSAAGVSEDGYCLLGAKTIFGSPSPWLVPGHPLISFVIRCVRATTHCKSTHTHTHTLILTHQEKVECVLIGESCCHVVLVHIKNWSLYVVLAKKKQNKKTPQKNQSFNSGWAKPGWETGSDGDACSIPFLLPLAHHCSSHCLSMFKHQLCLLYFCKLRAHVCLGMESYPGEVFAKRVRQKAREDWAGRGGGGRGGLGGGLGGGGGGGGGRDYTLTPAGCGDSPVGRSQDRRRRTRKRDALAATLTAFFSFLFFSFFFSFLLWRKRHMKAERESTWFVSDVFFPRRIFTHQRRGERETLQRWVLRGSPRSWRTPSPDKGTERGQKAKAVHDIFQKEDCKGGAVGGGLMTGLLILSVHQRHQRVLETLGWKSGECLELFLVLYETGD